MDASWVIKIFVPIDTDMTNLDQQTDVRTCVSDSEIVIVALVAIKYFANNYQIALTVMRQLQYVFGTMSHLRLNRPH